jgi:uncharacterized membrane protein YjjB (DUF3815 family)
VDIQTLAAKCAIEGLDKSVVGRFARTGKIDLHVVVTGIGIPVSGLTPLLPIPEDAFFSAVTTIGYVFRFNVTVRDSWACVICGVCCHALRTTLMHLGLDIVSGTLVCSMIAGLLAHLFARHFRTPSVTFAFPSIVALVPGSYAFRMVIGGLQILRDAGSSPGPLVAETISLALYTVLLTCAITIGLAVGLAVPVGNMLDEKHQ